MPVAPPRPSPKNWPANARRTITYDNGGEFARHEDVTEKIGLRAPDRRRLFFLVGGLFRHAVRTFGFTLQTLKLLARHRRPRRVHGPERRALVLLVRLLALPRGRLHRGARPRASTTFASYHGIPLLRLLFVAANQRLNRDKYPEDARAQPAGGARPDRQGVCQPPLPSPLGRTRALMTA